MDFEFSFNKPPQRDEKITDETEAEEITSPFEPIEGEGRLEMAVNSIKEEFGDDASMFEIHEIIDAANLTDADKEILRTKATSAPTIELLTEAKLVEDKIREAIRSMLPKPEEAAA